MPYKISGNEFIFSKSFEIIIKILIKIEYKI